MNDAAPAPVVAITGAAGGLGSALVTEFAQAGWRVAALCRQMPDTDRPGDILTLPCDVTQAAQVAEAFTAVLSHFGRLDTLINNAGIARDGLVPQLSEAAWDEVLTVNLKGAFLCAQAAIRPMLKQRDGHILNIASFGGRIGRAGQANYAASKAGLLGLTQSLAKEVGSRNVRVNAVLPGFLRTKLVGSLTEEQLAAHAASNTLGRLNDFGEVARFVTFLAGMKNVSGQLFQLDSRIGPWS